MRELLGGVPHELVAGRAVDGPAKGEQLIPIPALESDWGPWLRQHPGTVAYQMVEKFRPQPLPTTVREESKSSRLPFTDARLGPEERVFGLALGEASAAWPLRGFGKEPAVRHAEVGGNTAVLLWDGTTRSAAAFAPKTEGKDSRSVTLAVEGLVCHDHPAELHLHPQRAIRSLVDHADSL